MRQNVLGSMLVLGLSLSCSNTTGSDPGGLDAGASLEDSTTFDPVPTPADSGPTATDAGAPRDFGFAPDADVRPDTGPSDTGVSDSGPIALAPCPENVDCSTEHAECRGTCAITCLSEFPSGMMQDCTRRATCDLQSLPDGREIAMCAGGGWGDACDASFSASCDGEVATFCDRGRVALVTCPSAAHCWAEDERAGCASQPGQCSGHHGGCRGGRRSAPCCAGLVCSDQQCKLPEGGPCLGTVDCAHGLACRTADGEPVPNGQTGTCQVPSCVVASSQSGETCTWLPGIPCCGSADLTCDPMVHQCCFPSGVEPLFEGAIDPGLCCSGRTQEGGVPEVCE